MCRRWLALAGGTLCLLNVSAAGTAAVARGWSFEDALQAFVVSNVVIGLSFGLCGALIAWHRPHVPLGWLYVIGGLGQTASAAAAPLSEVLHDSGAPIWLVRLDLTVFNFGWPVLIGITLPLSLLLLPDGALPSSRWRPVALAVALTAPLFVIEIGTAPVHERGLPDAFGTLRHHDQISWLWTLSEVRWMLSMAVGLVALVVRYRRGGEALRRQLLWVLAAAAVLVAGAVSFGLVAATPVAVLFTIPLLPAAIAVAVLRHQLFDIRVVIARGATYALLSGLVLAAYAGLVVVLSGVTSALIVALLALPLRARLQRAVDGRLYGQRSDPLRVAARVGGRLGTGLSGSVAEVREALRLPYVAVAVDDAVVASAGALTGKAACVPLADGSFVVGLRPGEKRLSAADERVLRLLAGPLSAAVSAMRLSGQLQVSRERLVVAREEERRRLRREIHDGLGPLLTGVALSADAAGNLIVRSPQEALALVNAVRTDSRTAISEVRRIVDDLRPPALDELGLVGALEARAARTARRTDGQELKASVDAPELLPALPAAVEVAAYRIATEALTNVVRHSTAGNVVVRLSCAEELCIEVVDDGLSAMSWRPGLGLTSMHKRAAELGGHCEVGPGTHGGRVRVSLPLVGA